ncbi:MAG: IS1595 family transposase [Acidobacteriaceae bacterium]
MPKSLKAAIEYFADEKVCINAVAAMRWIDGKPVCPKCGVAETNRKHYWLKTQRRWKCYACRKQFSVKQGTIFEDSPIELSKWMCALWLIVNCKNGVSSYEVARDLEITQKSAWFVLQRLRYILKDVSVEKMGGTGTPVQMDESFHGGKPKNMHRSKRLARQVGMNGYADKTAVFGMLETGTRQVRAMVVPNVKRVTLQKAILDNVGFGAHIHTDQWPGYDGLAKQFVHETVNHMETYVTAGGVHTQAIENFWSLLKRGLQGTYVAVEPIHMDRYLDEQMFRFNNRLGHNDGTRFTKALSQVAGRRLTYRELTGKAAASAA